MNISATHWDCHAHAFGTADRFPPITERGYDPPRVLPEDHISTLQGAGLNRIVWVQPSIYGADNAALFDTLNRFPDVSRGIAAPPPKADKSVLDAWHQRGVRGLRLNLISKGGNSLADITPFSEKMKALGWHVAAFLDGTDETVLNSVIESVEVPIVLDHFGFAGGRAFPGVQAFRALIRWVEKARITVKLSAPYAIGAMTGELAVSLLKANPFGVVFGSNWPHIGQSATVSLSDFKNSVAEWCDKASVKSDLIFHENASRLYG
jgi:predicted TIM-barrel fold metal-dependent hydrolase